jgi:sporulation protein YlmC with PRC-barrel domain
MKNPLHLERLLGKQVHDSSGKRLGRLEEIHAEAHGDELWIHEYIVGAYGLLERFAAVPFRLGVIPFAGPKKFGRTYKIPWDKMDLADPNQPRTTCPKRKIEELNAK